MCVCVCVFVLIQYALQAVQSLRDLESEYLQNALLHDLTLERNTMASDISDFHGSLLILTVVFVVLFFTLLFGVYSPIVGLNERPCTEC